MLLFLNIYYQILHQFYSISTKWRINPFLCIFLCLQPIFLQDLSVLNVDSEMNGSVYSSFNGSETSFNTSENPRTLKLGDCKKSITLLAPSVSECSLWVRRITDARKRFVENERSRIQRQRSSESSKQAHFKFNIKIRFYILLISL